MEPKEAHEIIAGQIRARATAKGISFRALAEKAQTSRTHLTNVLNGERSPTVTWLCRVAAVLGCQPYDLMRPPRRKKKS